MKIWLGIVLLLLAGCGSRVTNPLPIYNPGDANTPIDTTDTYDPDIPSISDTLVYDSLIFYDSWVQYYPTEYAGVYVYTKNISSKHIKKARTICRVQLEDGEYKSSDDYEFIHESVGGLLHGDSVKTIWPVEVNNRKVINVSFKLTQVICY